MELEVSIFKEDAAGEDWIEGVGWETGTERQRDTDREMLDLHGWELVGSG